MHFPLRTLALSSTLGTVKLPVLLADTRERQERGLQGKPLRRAMGMFFVWRGTSKRTIHMQNVAEPLDVLFFDARGFLVSARRLSPNGPGAAYVARTVLELPARHRLVERLGMHNGGTRVALLSPPMVNEDGSPCMVPLIDRGAS